MAVVGVDRRRTVDLRRGAERRSTLDRRGRASRTPSVESPGEHLRNALQLLHQLQRDAEVSAVMLRLERALQLLERRANR